MDSRAPIEIIFDQGIGDLFGIRIAGNIVNDDVLGSMEYATKVVGSKLVVVLGHTSCGAVKGSIDDAKLGNLTGLLAKIRPAVSASGPGSAKDDVYVNKVAQANVSQAMKEIREKSPTIKAQLDAGTVQPRRCDLRCLHGQSDVPARLRAVSISAIRNRRARTGFFP